MLRHNKVVWQELEIVWLEPGYYPYLREDVVTRGWRATEISGDRIYGKLVAYAKLKPDAPNNGSRGRFDRRIWYLKPHDTPQGWPCEAVDPHTISASVRSARDCLLRDWLTGSLLTRANLYAAMA